MRAGGAIPGEKDGTGDRDCGGGSGGAVAVRAGGATSDNKDGTGGEGG